MNLPVFKKAGSIDLMFGEKRKHQRYVINRAAKYQTDSGTLPRDCMITDISERGARLFITDAEVPDQFYLTISGEKLVRQDCCVVWRLGHEIGVKFVTDERNKERAEAISRLRSQARQAKGTTSLM